MEKVLIEKLYQSHNEPLLSKHILSYLTSCYDCRNMEIVNRYYSVNLARNIQCINYVDRIDLCKRCYINRKGKFLLTEEEYLRSQENTNKRDIISHRCRNWKPFGLN